MSRQSNSDHRSAITRRSLLASAALLITTAGVHARVVTKVLPWQPNEAYPVKPVKPGERVPTSSAYTGTVRMFEEAGFSAAQIKDRGKRRMRVAL